MRTAGCRSARPRRGLEPRVWGERRRELAEAVGLYDGLNLVDLVDFDSDPGQGPRIQDPRSSRRKEGGGGGDKLAQ
jgi:hypothetical protein